MSVKKLERRELGFANLQADVIYFGSNKHCCTTYMQNPIQNQIKPTISQLRTLPKIHKEKNTYEVHIQLHNYMNLPELRNWENILIRRNLDCIVNFEILPADHLTKKFHLKSSRGQQISLQVQTEVSE